MDKTEQLWNRIAGQSGLSDEAMPGQTIIEIFGSTRVLIENHRGVKVYEREKMLVKGKHEWIQIGGKCLQLTKMSREILVIRGDIQQISIQRRV